MSVLDYTTYAEIRAALGVSATELPDTVLAVPMYATLLDLDLESVSANGGIPALYATVAADTSRTAQEQRFYDLTRLFASYSLAKNLLSSLPLFSVQSLTDGRAEFHRQADVIADIVAGVNGIYNAVRTKLSAAYLVLVPGIGGYVRPTAIITAAEGLAVDPVTTKV